MNNLLNQLAEPFPPSAITWKPGHTKDNKCMAMAYADLRAYQERLDAVCGLDWSVRYMPWSDGRIICELTIGSVTRASTGEMDEQDKKNGMGGTVAEAQAMKRAAAQFGLGRYLYDLPSVWVEFDAQRKRISDAGKAELDNRYKAWYAKSMATRAKATAHNGVELPVRSNDTNADQIVSQEAATQAEGDILFGSDEPTDTELTIVGDWRSRKDAEMWAIMVGACENEYEAKKSLDKVVAKHGGKVTMDNVNAVYLDFVRRQREKLAQQPVMNGVAA